MNNAMKCLPMSAADVIRTAKQLGLKSVLVKTYRNGYELRAYSVPNNGGVHSANIRAAAADHA